MILPTPLESLYLTLKAVKREVEDGTVRNSGICASVAMYFVATHRAPAERPADDPELDDQYLAAMEHLHLMFDSLGLDPDYPVPSPDPNLSADEIYWRREIPKWTGEYGAARRAVLDQLIKRCGNLLGAPGYGGNDGR